METPEQPPEIHEGLPNLAESNGKGEVVKAPGVTLYYNYTPCAFSLKIIGPLPIVDGYKIYPPLLPSKVGLPPFADIQNV
jgi:hypothetical protein